VLSEASNEAAFSLKDGYIFVGCYGWLLLAGVEALLTLAVVAGMP